MKYPIDLELFATIMHYQYMSSSDSPLWFLKSNRVPLTLLKSNSFLEQLKHGTSNLREILNIFPIVTSKTQKASNFSYILRNRQLVIVLIFSRSTEISSLDTIWPRKNYFLKPKLVLNKFPNHFFSQSFNIILKCSSCSSMFLEYTKIS